MGKSAIPWNGASNCMTLVTRGIGPGITLATFGFGPVAAAVAIAEEIVRELVIANAAIAPQFSAKFQFDVLRNQTASITDILNAAEVLIEAGLIDADASVEDRLRAIVQLIASLDADAGID